MDNPDDILASAICRKAAEIINQNGWCQGAHARDTNGTVCPIKSGDAATFSLYGAVSRALYLLGCDSSDKAMQHRIDLWQELTHRAGKERGQYSGVHPVMDFNDDRNRSQGEVVGFLGDCAYALEQRERAKMAEMEGKS
jgi:hypothetical protein